VKQNITTTLSNCVEILTLHERKMESTTIYEDNSASISQLKERYTKDLLTKSLSRRTFEQLIHKIGLCHLNGVNLHEGEK